MKRIEHTSNDKRRNENLRNGTSTSTTERNNFSTTTTCCGNETSNCDIKRTAITKLNCTEGNGKCSEKSTSNDISGSDFNESALMFMVENGCENEQLRQKNASDVQSEMENLNLHTVGNKMGPLSSSLSLSLDSKENKKNVIDISNVITTTNCTKTPKAPDDIIPNASLHSSGNKNTIQFECTKQIKDIKSMTDEEKESNIFSSLENCHTQHSSLDSGLMETCLKPAKGISSKLQSIDSRPIYPNVPYSPYGSPHTNRRRPPLRESRRISIESRGSFLQLNQYKLMDQIGQGSYGLVKLAYSEEDSTHYAMKILSKRRLLRQAALMRRGPKKVTTTSPLDRVYREIAVLKKLDHPNVVKLVEVLDDSVDDSLYLVFELVKHGEVLSIPSDKPLSEERAWSVFRDTLLGLEYLHYQRIIHADLKPGNLLLTECGHIKIADLGVCNEFLGEDATISNASTASTPAFRAPETLQLGNHSYCGKASDIWALGATLYALVFGNVPFIANTIPVLYEKIKNNTLMFPEHIQISDELKDCIECMLTKDPVKRITLPKLKEHTWVTMGGVHPLPTEEENCCLVQISEEDINSVVRSIPKLDTLILIKTMLKNHSFGNPFNKSGGISGRAPQRGGSRLERFVRAGRSNSAPGAYNAAMDRQFSSENMLPSLSESGTPSTNIDE